ncbi:MAG: DUF3301 domain-containing protein [Sterolibacterium sp.]
MPGFEFVSLMLLGGFAWFWFDSLKTRDAAIAATRRACETEGLLLLDDTVVIVSLKPDRDAEGGLKLRRVYEFEYSDTGNNRRKGSVVILGYRILVINIGLRLVPGERTLH